MISVTRRSTGAARSWAVVDLDAVTHNFRELERLVGVPVIGVIKADAYGHGAIQVAEALIRAGASMLAVVCIEEALELRLAGIDVPLLVLSEPAARGKALEEEIAEGLGADVHFGVYSSAFLEALISVSERLSRLASVHIKVDTGMHRLGANPSEALGLLRAASDSPWIEVRGLWTHMAVADDPTDDFTHEQLRRFRQFLQEARVALGRGQSWSSVKVHAANSAAAVAFPESRFDAVRAGICLYGERPSPGFPFPDELRLRPVLRWESTVALIKEVPRGSRPSYGRTRAVEGTGLAVIPVGYADGYMRALSNKADILIRGKRHRIAGTVTMDHVIVECAGGSDSRSQVRPGDVAVLIGRQGEEEITVTELAQKAGTIPYEVFTRIGNRVRRLYEREEQ